MVIRKISFILIASISLSHAFDFGEGGSDWGMRVNTPKNEWLEELRLGIRLQAIMSHTTKDEGNSTISLNDVYMRRTRFNVGAKLPYNMTFYMDIRNDKVNRNDSGEGSFNVGDAYIKGGSKTLSWKILRGKVDVSRSQTVSSSRLVFLNRANVSNFASQYVSHNRRATNFQANGWLFDKLHYHLVLGDGVQNDKFVDAQGTAADSITKQNFMYGGKLKYSPFTGWEDKKVKETYYGKGKHFSLGLGAFTLDGVQYRSSSTDFRVDRSLYNAEVSFHYFGFNFIGEYFIFDGQIKDLATNTDQGRGEGGYVTLEYTLTQLHHLAPFMRLESWNKFEDEKGFGLNSQVFGLNYYLNGEKMRIGLAYTNLNAEAQLKEVSQTRVETFLMMNF